MIDFKSRLNNPLHGIPKSQLATDVARFTNEHNLSAHVDLFQKGALVAQSPGAVSSIRELSSADREILHDEKTRRWHHPKILYFTIIMNSIAAAIQGWDQTGSNGANLSFPIEFNIRTDIDSDPDQVKNEWIVGLINAA